MTYIIGFSGVSGSGKTTLVNELRRTLMGHDVIVVDEVARDVLNTLKETYGEITLNDIRSNSSLLTYFQGEILRRQLQCELQTQHAKIVLCDRTIYDNLIYALYYGGLKTLINILDYNTLYVLQHMVGNHYDVIFLCEPINTDDCNLLDSVRTESDIKDRKIMKQWFRRLVPYDYVLPPVSLSERIDICLKVFKERGII